MRRNDKEIRDRDMIDAIIARAPVCRLALSDDDVPYVVPMNFGYRDGVLYFHSAPEGRKIDIIRRNPRVCFEMDIDRELILSESPCRGTMKYRSVIGFGIASLVDNTDKKRAALAAIIGHYADDPGEVPMENVHQVAIIRVTIDAVTGKSSGY